MEMPDMIITVPHKVKIKATTANMIHKVTRVAITTRAKVMLKLAITKEEMADFAEDKDIPVTGAVEPEVFRGDKIDTPPGQVYRQEMVNAIIVGHTAIL
jgi:hypothetical protein